MIPESAREIAEGGMSAGTAGSAHPRTAGAPHGGYWVQHRPGSPARHPGPAGDEPRSAKSSSSASSGALSELADADLIVACDGANSTVRRLHGDHFQTNVEVGRNKYIWLGTDKVFDTFTFAFEEVPAGWLWFHGYRFCGDASTCIVECPQETWEGLGFDTLGPDETLRCLEGIFQRQLAGHSLFNQRRDLDKAPWLNFRRITNEHWYHDKVVLMGDAAHTTHFTIGSGTKLAIQDAIGLAARLDQHDDAGSALGAYARERQAALARPRRSARNSTRWFESIPGYIDLDARQFATLLGRRDRFSRPLAQRSRDGRGSGGAARTGPRRAGRGAREPSVPGGELGGPSPAGAAGLRRPGAADRLRMVRRLGDPAGDRDVRVGRQLRRREPVLRRGRRLSDPALDLALYGGEGAPQDASPSEQSAIASQIWADSGPSAWVCAQ